jgi:hypothetical protein
LWLRQAKVINRSPTHLQKIESLRRSPNNQEEFLEISRRTYKVRCLDLDEFNHQALQLMEGRHFKGWFEKGRLSNWRQLLKRKMQAAKTWLQKTVNQAGKGLYNLIK